MPINNPTAAPKRRLSRWNIITFASSILALRYSLVFAETKTPAYMKHTLK